MSRIEYTEEKSIKIIKELNKVIDEYGNTGYASKMINELLDLAYEEGINYQRNKTIGDLELHQRNLSSPQIIKRIQKGK